jgi:hypothetical protein
MENGNLGFVALGISPSASCRKIKSVVENCVVRLESCLDMMFLIYGESQKVLHRL